MDIEEGEEDDTTADSLYRRLLPINFYEVIEHVQGGYKEKKRQVKDVPRTFESVQVNHRFPITTYRPVHIADLVFLVLNSNLFIIRGWAVQRFNSRVKSWQPKLDRKRQYITAPFACTASTSMPVQQSIVIRESGIEKYDSGKSGESASAESQGRQGQSHNLSKSWSKRMTCKATDLPCKCRSTLMFLSPLWSKNAMLCLAEAEWRLRRYQSLRSVPQYHLHRFSCLSNALPHIVLIQLLCAQTHLSKHSWHLVLELVIFGKDCVSHRVERERVFRNSSFLLLFSSALLAFDVQALGCRRASSSLWQCFQTSLWLANWKHVMCLWYQRMTLGYAPSSSKTCKALTLKFCASFWENAKILHCYGNVSFCPKLLFKWCFVRKRSQAGKPSINSVCWQL